MLSSYIVDFLLICIITLCYLTLYADPQLKIAIFWSHKTIVLCGALRVNRITFQFDLTCFIHNKLWNCTRWKGKLPHCANTSVYRPSANLYFRHENGVQNHKRKLESSVSVGLNIHPSSMNHHYHQFVVRLPFWDAVSGNWHLQTGTTSSDWYYISFDI